MTLCEAKMIFSFENSYDDAKLKKQYYLLLKKYHPDNCIVNGMDVNVANGKLVQINETYNVLKKNLEKSSDSNYFGHFCKKSSSCNRSYDKKDLEREKILKELWSKSKLNREGSKDFKKLMKAFFCNDIIILFDTLMSNVSYNINNIFDSKKITTEELKEKYKFFNEKYNISMLNIYNKFYEENMGKFCIDRLKDETLYTWILNNRNKNRKFDYISDITKQISRDLELVIAESNNRNMKIFISNMLDISENYKNYVFYNELEEEIKDTIDSGISFVRAKVLDKENKRKILRTCFYDTKKKTIKEIDDLFYNYFNYIKDKENRVDIKNKPNKKILQKELQKQIK